VSTASRCSGPGRTASFRAAAPRYRPSSNTSSSRRRRSEGAERARFTPTKVRPLNLFYPGGAGEWDRNRERDEDKAYWSVPHRSRVPSRLMWEGHEDAHCLRPTSSTAGNLGKPGAVVPAKTGWHLASHRSDAHRHTLQAVRCIVHLKVKTRALVVEGGSFTCKAREGDGPRWPRLGGDSCRRHSASASGLPTREPSAYVRCIALRGIALLPGDHSIYLH